MKLNYGNVELSDDDLFAIVRLLPTVSMIDSAETRAFFWVDAAKKHNVSPYELINLVVLYQKRCIDEWVDEEIKALDSLKK